MKKIHSADNQPKKRADREGNYFARKHCVLTGDDYISLTNELINEI